MARVGTILLLCTGIFEDYQDLGLQAKNGRFRVAVLIHAKNATAAWNMPILSTRILG